MSKIEYDNFPKFLVSLGVVLIALPFIIVLFFLQENSVLMVSEKSISELTEVAAQTIIAKQEFSHWISHKIIFLFISCILGGIFLLILGCKMWYALQRKIDDKQDVELKKAKKELENMNPEEKEEKIIREIKEIKEMEDISNNNGHENEKDVVLSVDEIREKQKSIRQEDALITRQIRKRYIEVEEAVIDILKDKLGYKYDIKTNVKIGAVEYDAIAIPRKGNMDYIFEIKYLFSAFSWNASAWSQIPDRLFKQVEIYSKQTNKKVTPILLLITLEDQVEKLKGRVKQRWANQNMTVKVLSEDGVDKLSIEDIIESF
jgi:predicted membrane protein